METHHGKVKIVCTIGPATHSVDMLVNLIHAGMDVARLNFSHGTHEDHLATIQNVRDAAKHTGVELTVLQDLQGPKIRIGALNVPLIEIHTGDQFTITTDPILGGAHRVSTSYMSLTRDVHTGDKILLDDGKLRLRVLEVQHNDILCEVVIGGMLSAHKGINVPGVAVGVPSFTEKDQRDLAFGLKHKIDCVALSFVRTADDIKRLRQVIINQIIKGNAPPIIAKIEKPQAIPNIDDIIAEADGIMIARGDLGVELPPEDVPILQKLIVKKCNQAGKPVIIATQMLESMIGNSTPTRAEASDVANAVIDGGDAVMLSGETSVGKYPIESVQIMNRIIKKVEQEHLGQVRVLDRSEGGVESRLDAIGRAACVLAEHMNAAAIVAVTRSGQTAKVISRYRPRPEIIAITDRPNTFRWINLFWGVRGLIIDELAGDSDKALQDIQERLVNTGMVKRGEYVVVLAGQPFFEQGSTNFIKVEKVH